MATEPQHSETMSGETTSSAIVPARADVGADVGLILEALGRIEAAAQSERAALDRLRTSLGDMAETIAKAKAVADSETAAALLDEFEHRVDAMIEIAGGPVPAARADAPPEAIAEPSLAPAPLDGPAAEADQVPTVSGVVSRLGPDRDPFNEAVVNALHSADAPSGQGPTVAMLTAMVAALTVPAPPDAQEPEASEPEAASEVPPPVEVAQIAEAPPPDAASAANAGPIAWPADAALHEGALLASLVQMGARPFPPPEEGTAVIFTARTDVETRPADPDFDPTDFLFGPEPEPDPAAFLLDPAPAPRLPRAPVLPQPEFVAPQAEEPQPAPPAAAGTPAEPEPAAPAPHDPLHALKAMSPEEKIALFT